MRRKWHHGTHSLFSMVLMLSSTLLITSARTWLGDAEGEKRICTIETVDTVEGYLGGGSMGWAGTTVAVDREGKVHICYFDDKNSTGDLKYAIKSKDHWSMDTVVSGIEENTCEMALDSSSMPHIIYQESSPFAFKYAYLDNGAWEQEIIDPSMNSPFFQSSIAVDGAGIPHVAYSQSWHNATFRYAERINGIWNITVLNASKNAHAPSIAVTSMGDPHICYGNDTEDNNDSLEYLYFDGVQWKREILTKSKYTAIAPQIALDTEGVPHIVYAEGNNDYNDLHVIYTTKNGSTWVNTSFSPAQGDYNYASLALDANGYPHISMTNTIWDDLAYVHWNGTSWIEEVIDYMYSVGYNSDIAVDANGTAHFIYKDCTDWEYIRYATHRPASSNAFPTPPIRALGSWEGDSMVIRWREPHEDGGSNVTKYSIYRGSNLSNDPTPHQKVSLGIKDAGNYSILDLNYTTHQGIYSLRDRNITSGMTYYYYVVAHNEYGASRRSNGVILEINASTILGDHNDTNGESGGDDLDGDGLDTSIHPDEFDDDGGGDEPGSIPQQELNILIIIMIVMTIAAISVAVALIQARRRKNR